MRFIPSVGTYCITGDCDTWRTTGSYFTEMSREGALTIELSMKVEAPFTLDRERMIRAGFLVSSGRRLAEPGFNFEEEEGPWTELFGCNWSRKQFKPSRCASALSPTNFQRWLVTNKVKERIKYAPARNLWKNMDSRID